MTIPDKIYAKIIGGTLTSSIEQKEIFGEKYPEYIRKDALLEWAKNEGLKEHADIGDAWSIGYRCCARDLIDKIESL